MISNIELEIEGNSLSSFKQVTSLSPPSILFLPAYLYRFRLDLEKRERIGIMCLRKDGFRAWVEEEGEKMRWESEGRGRC